MSIIPVMCIDICQRVLSYAIQLKSGSRNGNGKPAEYRRSAPEGGWTALIDDILTGDWINPETGSRATVPYEKIVIKESLDGAEADLVASLGLGERYTVVADEATWDAMGGRVAAALKSLGPVDTVILDHPHADMGAVNDLTERLANADAVVAVGSGTINDLCKFVTGRINRRLPFSRRPPR